MIYNGVEIDLANLVERWGLKVGGQSGDEMVLECPWKHHSNGQYKLYLNTRRGLWQCHACGDKKGNLLQLVGLLEGLDYDEAATFLLDRAQQIDYREFRQHIRNLLHGDDKPLSVRTPRELTQETLNVLSYCRWNFEVWRKLRGFSERTQRHWGLRVTNKRHNYPLLIPFWVDSKEVYHIRRAGSREAFPKYLYQRGMPRTKLLYGLDQAQSGTLVLVEGPLDAIAVWQALDRAELLDRYSPVAIMGSYLSEWQAQLIKFEADEVILFFDNDRGGEIALQHTRKRLNESLIIQEVDYSGTSAKDPGEMTPDQIVKVIEQATINFEVEV